MFVDYKSWCVEETFLTTKLLHTRNYCKYFGCFFCTVICQFATTNVVIRSPPKVTSDQKIRGDGNNKVNWSGERCKMAQQCSSIGCCDWSLMLHSCVDDGCKGTDKRAKNQIYLNFSQRAGVPKRRSRKGKDKFPNLQGGQGQGQLFSALRDGAKKLN